MKRHNFVLMLFIMISMSTCSPFKSVSPSIKQKNLPENCKGLVTLIKNNWKQHKNLKYYRYDEEFLVKILNDYKSCLLLTLKKKEIIELFGIPTKGLDDAIYYSLDKGCSKDEPFNCRILIFQFGESDGNLVHFMVKNHGKSHTEVPISAFTPVNPIINQEDLSSNCKGLIDLVKKNWKQHKKLKYYKYDEEFLTTLQRDYQECLMAFEKQDIINLLGKPTEDLEDDYIFYALHQGCMDLSPKNCKVLFFQFKKEKGLLMMFMIQDYTTSH